MLSTELHVYRKALGAAGGAKKGLGKEDGGGVGGVGGAAAAGSPRGKGGVRRHKEVPHSFALLTSMGIYHGSLALGNDVRVAGRGAAMWWCCGRRGWDPGGCGESLGIVLEKEGLRRFVHSSGFGAGLCFSRFSWCFDVF